MAVISAEQRLQEVKYREDMMTNTETLTEDEKKQMAAQLEVRDRLMRRLTKKKVITKIIEGEDAVTITTRLMNGRQRAQFINLNKMLDDSKADLSKYNPAMDGLKELAADLNQTPELDRDYWMGGDISDDVVLIVLLNTFNGAANAVMEGISSFRPK